jgi:hypothetical protein
MGFAIEEETDAATGTAGHGQGVRQLTHDQERAEAHCGMAQEGSGSDRKVPTGMSQHLERLNLLAPFLQDAARRFIALARERQSITLFVVHTYRDYAEQMRLYQQGRIFDREFNEWIVSDPAKLVTNAKPGLSPHNLVDRIGKPASLALDVIPLSATGTAIWDTPDTVWSKLYDLAWDCGLDPLGDEIGAYLKGDKGHFEEPAWKLKLAGLGLVQPVSLTPEVIV